DQQRNDHRHQKRPPNLLYQADQATGPVVHPREVEAFEQFGDPVVGEHARLIFRRRPVDGEQLFPARIHPPLVSLLPPQPLPPPTRLVARGCSRPAPPARIGRVGRGPAPPAMSPRCSNTYSTTPFAARDESRGSVVVAQK